MSKKGERMEIVAIVTSVIALIAITMYIKRGKELLETEKERDYYVGVKGRVQNYLEELPDDATISESRKGLFDLMHTYKSSGS